MDSVKRIIVDDDEEKRQQILKKLNSAFGVEERDVIVIKEDFKNRLEESLREFKKVEIYLDQYLRGKEGLVFGADILGEVLNEDSDTKEKVRGSVVCNSENNLEQYKYFNQFLRYTFIDCKLVIFEGPGVEYIEQVAEDPEIMEEVLNNNSECSVQYISTDSSDKIG